ncbi:lysosome-associated membrane glycoprotein 3 [Pundamilia nyererei]|uniref:Lysosome-associated membrane glycoprotein 3 n=1 Tax=Pundamilia nyererei TaxID=303518 RepID=A0A9Y3VYW2_9CICH|nr:PREDICTED: lysosome-associated membrane glycoprotein 3-like [Pundamilia nyererei]
MLRTAVFVFIACCALSALSLAGDTNKSKPSATVAPASQFDSSNTTTTKHPNTTTTKHPNAIFIVQPQLTSTSGSCNENSANLKISFKEGFINFSFTKSVPNNTVYVDAVSFSLNYPLTTERTTYNANNKSVHLFPAQIGHSYSCSADSIYMGNDLSLDVNSDRTQAFNLTKNNFGDRDYCPADQRSYKIAIGVGVALLVLIVVVVVAYLVSRKRRTDGYQSL